MEHVPLAALSHHPGSFEGAYLLFWGFFFIIFCYKSLAPILWISFFQVLSHT